MDDKTIEELKKQHLDNYLNSLKDCILNNTNVLIDEDIMSLIRKPPLDSMDLIKSKFIDLAKKNNIILNTDDLDKLMDLYRNNLIKECDELKKIRNKELNNILDKADIKDSNIFKLNKKDFLVINREIKKRLKDNMNDCFNKYIISRLDNIYSEDVDDKIKDKISVDISKYYKNTYQKQLLDNFDIKILVKDTTLINTIKEHSERYLFTLNNSRLFNC